MNKPATAKEPVQKRGLATRQGEESNGPMDKICIGGGQFRSTVFRELNEWESCKQAMFIELDPATRTSRSYVEYVSPQETCPDDLPAILFKSATLRDNRLYACTSTEVLIYEVPSFRQITYISLPFFNDLHHVYPTPQGTLLVMVTGLDIVAEVSLEGELLRHWDVMGEDTWSIFSKDIDYRKVPTTKPHRAHANHIFQVEDEIWVTRFHQRDAISLTSPGRRIEIAIQRPHDGFLFNGSLYFTTVDGHVLLANPKTLQLERVIDLNKFSGQGDETLGWCRGLLPLDERFLWVGFSRVRPTKFRENLNWIRQLGQSHRGSHVALYDLERETCIEDIETEPHGVGVIFTMFQPQSAPAEIARSPRSDEPDSVELLSGNSERIR